jgi:hypothetical protein
MSAEDVAEYARLAKDLGRKLFEEVTMGAYHLYGTRPDGARVEIATTIGGKTTILDPALYKVAMLPPPTSLAAVRITPEAIDAIYKDLLADRALRIRAILQKYQGWTWKAALDAHSVEKPPQ